MLTVEHLSLRFSSDPEVHPAVDDVSFEVRPGETLCLVGESGCGKSSVALAILGLTPPPGRITGGRIRFEDQNLNDLAPDARRQLLGRSMAMIFQEPMTALNPVLTCGDQIMEAIALHQKITRHDTKTQAAALCKEVGLSEPESVLQKYPHELSGGMRQRIMIAMALAGRPKLLIADEPTTALDVTIQAQILDLLRSLQQRFGLGLLLITHDFGVVAQMADRIAVMYASRIVETGTASEVFQRPRHPYTAGLLKAIPKISEKKTRLEQIPGQVPDPAEKLAGCRFEPRCSEKIARCSTEVPPLEGQERLCACWSPLGDFTPSRKDGFRHGGTETPR